MVVTVGQNDTRLLQRDPHLTGDIVGIGRIHSKWATELVHADDLSIVMRRAFKMALQPPCGPVVVSISQNVLEQELTLTPPPASADGCGPAFRVRADREAVTRAAQLLAAARHPLLLVESGVARSDALDEVVRLAELTGARVYQAWMSDVNFPVTHPQYLGDLDPTSPPAAAVLAHADVLVGVGCSLFSHGFLPGDAQLPQGLKLIHIDDDPWEIGKNLPTDCGLLGDVKATLAELNAALDGALSSESRQAASARSADIARDKSAATDAWESVLAASPDTTPIPIPRLMAELRKVVEADTVVVDEAWSASAALRRTLPLDRPYTFFRARNGGSIGSGLPLALGVSLGLPGRQVLAIVGDGSAAWSMQSLWTAARYEIPVTFVITNNAIYGQVKLVRRAVLGDYPLDETHEGMDIDRPVIDFSLLARAMGVEGTRVSEAGHVAETVREALASGRPRLVEVMVESAPA
jgi:benzoylformate decarboxylase